MYIHMQTSSSVLNVSQLKIDEFYTLTRHLTLPWPRLYSNYAYITVHVCVHVYIVCAYVHAHVCMELHSY